MSDQATGHSTINWEELKSFIRETFQDSPQKLALNLEDSLFLLDWLKDERGSWTEFFKEFPLFKSLFEQDFYSYEYLAKPALLKKVVLTGSYLDPNEKKFPISVEGKLERSILENYKTVFFEWRQSTQSDHYETQDWIEKSFNTGQSLKSLKCNCFDCIADYRTKLRKETFNSLVELVDKQNTWLEGGLEHKSIDQISASMTNFFKKIDQDIKNLRNKLKRASVTKLKGQIDNRTKDFFHPDSTHGKTYFYRIHAFFLQYCDENNHDRFLVEEEEFKKFYRQQGTSIWRSKDYLEREFAKLLKAILFLKRKDISSQILQDYLGQFWLHSSARNINRKIVYHMGPTNSGKTYHAIKRLGEVGKGCYLAPLRLLATEQYDNLNEMGVKTSLLTGEEVIEVPDATHTSSTVEMAKLHEDFDCVVIDEIQMIRDSQRGWAWTRAFVNISSPEIHICGDHSVLDLIREIIKLTGDTLEVKNYTRMTELVVMDAPLSKVALERGDALIVFSRRNALKWKSELEKMGLKVSIIYGRLSPEVRREQARKFDVGETDVLVSTDAISMGMNLPIKRIIFTTLIKYINEKEIQISNSDIKQIAGRAGRYKRFPTGYVSCLSSCLNGISTIRNAISMELAQKDLAMVGPDQGIFDSVNKALADAHLGRLKLSDFLRLFNTMIFRKPFYCVDLKEMIDLAEIVEAANIDQRLSSQEIFGFTCAPVNMGLVPHIEYYNFILNQYVQENPIRNQEIDSFSNDIDYLETSIKCVELFQWLSRHFKNNGFEYDEVAMLENKGKAVDKLNTLLSEKIIFKDWSRRRRNPRDRNDNKKKSFSNSKSNPKSGFKKKKHNGKKKTKHRKGKGFRK